MAPAQYGQKVLYQNHNSYEEFNVPENLTLEAPPLVSSPHKKEIKESKGMEKVFSFFLLVHAVAYKGN